MKTNLQPTSDMKTALLSVSGETINHGGRRWRLSVDSGISRAFNTPFFHCTAQNLTPKNEEESKFCITDLWQSESEDSARLLYKFAAMGGFTLPA